MIFRDKKKTKQNKNKQTNKQTNKNKNKQSNKQTLNISLSRDAYTNSILLAIHRYANIRVRIVLDVV